MGTESGGCYALIQDNDLVNGRSFIAQRDEKRSNCNPIHMMYVVAAAIAVAQATNHAA